MTKYTDETTLPADSAAIRAIRAEITRLEALPWAQGDQFIQGMVQAYCNVLATIDPQTCPGGARDDFGKGIVLVECASSAA